MPFKSRRRPRPKSRMSNKSGSKALKLVRSLKPFIDRELHFIDFSTGGTAIGVTTTTTFLALSLIAEGVQAVDRTGSQCTLRTMAMKLFWTVGNADACCRVTIFRDNQGNGGVPTSVELYENTGAAVTLVSPMNNDFLKRFRILQDYHVSLSNNWRPVVCLKKFRRLGTIMRWSGPGAVVGDQQSGGIWMAVTSNTGGGGANPTLEIASRIRFAP